MSMKQISLLILLSTLAGSLIAGELPAWSPRAGGPACVPCDGGNSDMLDVSTFLNIDFGPGLNNEFVGSLVLRATGPSPQLATRAGLELVRDLGSSEPPEIRLEAGELRQITTHRLFINIAKNTAYKYTIRVMHRAARGALVDG